MIDVKTELLGVVAEAYTTRLKPRLDGLTDEEYLWEPAAVCWNVRRTEDGTVRSDWGVVWDADPPFTTIAWRMCHLIDCYGSRRAPAWLGLDQHPNPLEDGVPGTATDALDKLDRAHDLFVGYVQAIDEAELGTKIGPVGGIYAEHTKLSLLMHQLDEVVHHGAEIALLRDLYRAQQPKDPFVLACLTADRRKIDELVRGDGSFVERTVKAQPDLVLQAAEIGRWDAVAMLVELGFPIEGPDGRGPLHHAAAAGDLDAARLLVGLGADLEAKDPTYDATPLGWAEYFREQEAADYLRSVSSAG